MLEEEKKAIEYLEYSLKSTVTHKEQLNIIKKLIQKQQKEIEKKSKIIDEMAEHIVSSAIVDDTVCAIKFCEVEEDCTHEKMLKCTKHYFENKLVEKVEE